MWDQPVPHLAPHTTSLNGDFFNSIVVRHPFNLISDSSEWWLFYVLVVILILFTLSFCSLIDSVCQHPLYQGADRKKKSDLLSKRFLSKVRPG